MPPHGPGIADAKEIDTNPQLGQLICLGSGGVVYRKIDERRMATVGILIGYYDDTRAAIIQPLANLFGVIHSDRGVPLVPDFY
ncbi:hypothetical protein [Nocardia sp. CNY236]|uniref:hypothetical protein n=1 Tax=Nocardia sp. CNY236 TaxID=1169152 RepID=UPI000420CBEF|nr:hypothetical protein [Nocardia sp. CNY236]